ncbi:uncharacterized protein LOC120004496 isoform X1 [Tripterygium wilfordii]|uniref:uncharacterized protein LOC120004496 isoform X1 n=1 Tax=Tripterygium wilfordii TaxID=458696 RepID=UPI0018F80AB0|nr:uncharacterized protein LOC120004496 isoform X1 [Tripterygium wilfordii]
MNSGRDDLCSLAKSKSEDDTSENYKESKLSYTRDFLLSLAELDPCKRLPNEFDSSVFGEGNGLGGLSQSYRSSDFGGLNCNRSQPSWQNPGPGLLGSFALQRVYEHVAGTLAPQIQENSYHLLKSSAPYCPPHISKAKLHSKRQSNDLHNDETFCSSYYLSPERAEDERRRRDSFELIRREQQKAIQEKQNLGQQKENSDPEISKKYKASTWHSSSSKPSSATQLVTPAFERISLEENSATKPLAASPLPELCHVKDDLTRSSVLASSNLNHQSLKDVIKTAGSISSGHLKGVSEMHVASHYEANSKSFSSGRDELLNKLMAFTSRAADENSNKLYTYKESTVTPGVLTCNDLEQSISSDGKKDYYTRRGEQGWSTCDMEDNQTNSSSSHGVSQCLNSLLDKGKSLSDSETSSILSMGSPDGVYLYEAGDDGKHLNTLNTEISKKMFTQYGTLGAGLSKELLSIELETGQEVYMGRMTKNDALEPIGGLHSVNRDAISLTIDGSIGINHIGFEIPICANKSGLSTSKGDQCTGNDIPMKAVYPTNGSDGKANSFDDLCLPDEDSLITVDDWIFPEDSISMPDGISNKADLLASNTPGDVAQKLAASFVSRSDERYTRPNREGPTSRFSMSDRVGMETSYHNLQPQLSHLQPLHSRASEDWEFFHHSKSQRARLSSMVEPLGFRTDPYEPPPYRCSPSNVCPYPFQHPHVEPTLFDHQRIHSPLELMPVPRNYPPPNQVGGMSNFALPHHLVHQMPYHAEDLHQLQKGHPMNYQHPIYHGFEMQNLDHRFGIGSNQSACSGLYEKGVRREQRTPVKGGKEIFGNQVNFKR